jgi:hypothetical protein
VVPTGRGAGRIECRATAWLVATLAMISLLLRRSTLYLAMPIALSATFLLK